MEFSWWQETYELPPAGIRKRDRVTDETFVDHRAATAVVNVEKRFLSLTLMQSKLVCFIYSLV